MNWKFVFQLSMLGLIMAFGTVALIPEKIEFVFWVPIFIIVAYMIAKVAPGKYFTHGFMVSIFNCVYLTTTHTVFLKTYLAHHPNMYATMQGLSGVTLPFMMGVGLGSGIFFGLCQGLFAFIASRFVQPQHVTI